MTIRHFIAMNFIGLLLKALFGDVAKVIIPIQPASIFEQLVLGVESVLPVCLIGMELSQATISQKSLSYPHAR
jgi:hypothetical protein